MTFVKLNWAHVHWTKHNQPCYWYHHCYQHHHHHYCYQLYYYYYHNWHLLLSFIWILKIGKVIFFWFDLYFLFFCSFSSRNLFWAITVIMLPSPATTWLSSFKSQVCLKKLERKKERKNICQFKRVHLLAIAKWFLCKKTPFFLFSPPPPFLLLCSKMVKIEQRNSLFWS